MVTNNLRFNKDVKFRRESFGGLVYNPTMGYTIEINQTAQLILELYSINSTLPEILNICADYYKKDKADMRSDLIRLLRSFVKYEILIEGKTPKSADKLKVSDVLERSWPKQIVQNGLNSPEVIHLAITEECPLNCPGCYVNAGNPLRNELKTEEILKFIDILQTNNVFQLGLGGGEAMVHEDLLEIIKYATKKEITVALTTSGVNLTYDMAKKLKNCGIKQIQISHDGYSKAVFEQSRSKGSFNIAKKAIKNLKRVGIDFGFNVLITPKVLKELSQLIAYAEMEGAIELILLRPKPSGRAEELDWFNENKLTIPHQNYLKKLLRRVRTSLKIRTDTSFCLLYSDLNPEVLYQQGVFGCTGAKRFCSINSDGSMFPCSHFFHFPEFNGGSCLNLIDNWQNSKAFITFRNTLENLEEPCGLCENLKICKGCRKVALAESHELNGLDPYCTKVQHYLSLKNTHS